MEMQMEHEVKQGFRVQVSFCNTPGPTINMLFLLIPWGYAKTKVQTTFSAETTG